MRRALRRSIRTDYPWEQRPAAQIEVLQMLAELGTCRMGDLAGQLRLAQSTVSALVTKLIELGLVTREVDAGDRRAAVVRLTAAGRDELDEWGAAHRRRLDAALRSLEPDDRAAVLGAVGALGRLAEALDEPS
ncbi:MarR family winged helix-turn-helix transcriptional regulator [Jatrophihabitans sp.]|uniref:MarR family winged helix-turn-helix transcriptional regulator n=1 Tax=Jatrophihabitans sp. TaxID=1932789 RepID=UPI0030C71077